MTEIRTALEMREAAEKMVRNWLETLGEDLAYTRDSYIEAARTGKHNGRTISTNFAKRAAEQFNERADAVHQCGALLERDIRAIPISPETDARDEELMLTIIARSIGRTVGVPNHMTRARDVLRSVKDADLTLPSRSTGANGSGSL